MPEADPRLVCAVSGTLGRALPMAESRALPMAESRGPGRGLLGPLVGARLDRSVPQAHPGHGSNAMRSETARLLAEIRNAEMAIRGFCELAAERIVAEGEALHGIASALGILARARSQAESVLAPDGRELGPRPAER